MPTQIFYDRPVQTHRNIGPSHTGGTFPIQLVLLPVHNILEVKDSRIVIVLTGEDNVVEIGGMDIGNSVLVRIPSAKAHIQTSHEGDSAIDQAQFFMVGPVEDHIIIHAIQTLERIAGHLCN
jgi:hypothetical protein